MTSTLQADPVPLRVEEDGTIRVGRSHVTLDLVIEKFQEGWSPEALVRGYDTLELADVYAAVTYYLRHPDEVKAYLARREKEAEEIRQKFQALPTYRPGPTWEELLARRARMEKGDAPATDG